MRIPENVGGIGDAVFGVGNKRSERNLEVGETPGGACAGTVGSLMDSGGELLFVGNADSGNGIEAGSTRPIDEDILQQTKK